MSGQIYWKTETDWTHSLVLKKDAQEYLEEEAIKQLVAKHSGFASSFPIYLFTSRTEEQPVSQDDMDASAEEKAVRIHLLR